MTDVIREAFAAILPPPERAKRLVGKTLDGYLLKEITKGGEGGFGVVYKAEHPELGKAAVKVLGIDVEEDGKAYQRFKREVKLLCDMGQAKNVVNIRHAGIEDGLPWLAMEYVDGESLHQWIAKKEITRDNLITILSEVLEGLHQVQLECRKRRPDTRKNKTGGAVSSKNDGPPISIVHRDIKPGNVMIVKHESGEIGAMLIDFGISGLFRERMEDVSIPSTSIPSMGTEFHRAYTPEYTSPELCLAPKSITVQSDIFQVGLIAFEMITGKRYWDVQSGAEKELKRAKGWPRWLKKVIARSLNWDRTKRFYSPLEFQQALNYPYREGMKSLVVKPKRLAASIATIAIVVLGILLAIYVDSTAGLRRDNAGLEEQLAGLQKENTGLQKEKTNLHDQIKAMSNTPEGEKIEELENTIAKLERKLATPTITSPSDLVAMQDEIRVSYDAFLTRNIAKKYENLKEKCLSYQKEESGKNNEFREFVDKLLDWMEVAEKGKIQMIPTRFIETKYFDWDIPMRYRFSQGNQKKESNPLDVNGEKELWKEKSEDCPSLTVPWVPGGEKLVIEVEQLDGEKVKHKGKESWAITGDIIHKSKEELSKQLEEGPLVTAVDSNYKFYYTIRRKGFGAIPKLPALAK